MKAITPEDVRAIRVAPRSPKWPHSAIWDISRDKDHFQAYREFVSHAGRMHMHTPADFHFHIPVALDAAPSLYVSHDERWLAVHAFTRLYWCPLAPGSVLREIVGVDAAGRPMRVDAVAWAGDELVMNTDEWVINRWTSQVVRSFDPRTGTLAELMRFDLVLSIDSSPDGRCITAYLCDGTTPVRGAAVPEYAHWTSDSRFWVAYDDHELTLHDGTTFTIPDVTGYACSPDGRRIAYAAHKELGILDADTHRKMSIEHVRAQDNIYDVQWTKFGIVFTRSNGTSTVFTENLDICDAYSFGIDVGYDFVVGDKYCVDIDDADRFIDVYASYTTSVRVRRMTAKVGIMALKRCMQRTGSIGGVRFEVPMRAQPAEALVARFLGFGGTT